MFNWGTILSIAASAGLIAAGAAPALAAAPSGGVCNTATGACYASIQEGVSAAHPGDTVTVAPGTYKESVTLNKSITLRGLDPLASVIDATGKSHGLVITGGPATVTGLKVQNANLAGVLVRNATQVVLDGNNVQDNDKNIKAGKTLQETTCEGAAPLEQADCGEGIELDGVTSSTISNNLVQGNFGGILLTDESSASHDNLIKGNMVANNLLDCGITLASHPASFGPKGPEPGNGVFNNRVEGNVVTGNGAAGVGLYTPTPGTSTHDNVIAGNTITKNGLPGVAMHAHAPGQNLNGNTITGNFIADNGADPDPGAPSSGIVVFSDDKAHADPILDTTVTKNSISGQSTGVWIGTGAITLGLTSNNLAGNDNGVANAGSAKVDGSANYWGCAAGPGGAGCAGTDGSVGAGSPASSPFDTGSAMGILRGMTVGGSLANQTGGATANFNVRGDGAPVTITVTFSGGNPNSQAAGIALFGPAGAPIAMVSPKQGVAVLTVPGAFAQSYFVQVSNYQPNTGVSYALTAS